MCVHHVYMYIYIADINNKQILTHFNTQQPNTKKNRMTIHDTYIYTYIYISK